MKDPQDDKFVRRTYSKVMQSLRSQLGALMVVGATFTLGYIVKNMEDRETQRAIVSQIAKQRETMAAECNARLVQVTEARDAQLTERDALLADQTQRLKEQTTLIQSLSDQVGHLAQQTDRAAKARSAQFSVVTKAVKEAQVAATEAATAAKKGATNADRARINNAVKGGAK